MTINSRDSVSRPSTVRKLTTLSLLVLAFGFLGLGVWGRVVHNTLLTVAGFLPFLLMLLVGMIYGDRRAKSDPALAARVTQVRADAKKSRSRDIRIHLTVMVMVLPVVVGALMIRLYWPGFAELPKDEQRLYLMPGGLVVVVLLNLLWWQLRKKKRNAA